jgi:thiol-disulfide isomerase/thioredoxin
MDRLSAVIVGASLGLGASGCESAGSSGTPPSRSRVDVVEATKPVKVDPKEFCETWHEPDAAPALAWPPLHEPGLGADGAQGRAMWINVWATWCKPCIEELPLLDKWRYDLGKKVDFSLAFLSADGDPAAVKEFAKAHPQVSGSLELQSAESLQPWATSIGVPGQAVLPIHVFVDGKNRVRCVRTAGIGEDDKNAVEQLLIGL